MTYNEFYKLNGLKPVEGVEFDRVELEQLSPAAREALARYLFSPVFAATRNDVLPNIDWKPRGGTITISHDETLKPVVPLSVEDIVEMAERAGATDARLCVTEMFERLAQCPEVLAMSEDLKYVMREACEASAIPSRLLE